jgi:hypothetical protein
MMTIMYQITYLIYYISGTQAGEIAVIVMNVLAILYPVLGVILSTINYLLISQVIANC